MRPLKSTHAQKRADRKTLWTGATLTDWRRAVSSISSGQRNDLGYRGPPRLADSLLSSRVPRNLQQIDDGSLIWAQREFVVQHLLAAIKIGRKQQGTAAL